MLQCHGFPSLVSFTVLFPGHDAWGIYSVLLDSFCSRKFASKGVGSPTRFCLCLVPAAVSVSLTLFLWALLTRLLAQLLKMSAFLKALAPFLLWIWLQAFRWLQMSDLPSWCLWFSLAFTSDQNIWILSMASRFYTILESGPAYGFHIHLSYLSQVT